MFIATVYATLGGLPTVIITDVIQFGLAMVGSVMLAIYAVEYVGGLDELVAQVHTTYGPGADKKVSEATFYKAMGHYLPLLQLEQMDKDRGVHPNTLFWLGSCADFEGRKFDGKVCPGPEPKSKSKGKKKSKKGKAAE